MDREQVIIIANDYAQLVKSLLSPDHIFLYGSYSQGTGNMDSDIDIAVIFDSFPGDYWQAVTKLHELTLTVDTRIEPVLLEKNNDPSGFVETVRKTGYLLS